MKETVPVITEEQAAQGDAAATAKAEEHMTALARAQSGEAEEDTAAEAGPKPHTHSYRKDGTCACGAVRKNRKSRKTS